ncbi:hypothetical protein GBA52_004671 [Prunus armeniaca]|nr:hypothetical protein GBA52_004671 [Prunus armeniaca]
MGHHSVQNITNIFLARPMGSLVWSVKLAGKSIWEILLLLQWILLMKAMLTLWELKIRMFKQCSLN